MSRLRAALAWIVALSLVCASAPASALTRAVPDVSVKALGLPSLTLPVLPALAAVCVLPQTPSLAVSAPVAVAADQKPSALAQLQAAEPTQQRSSEASAAASFDGALPQKKGELGLIAAAGAGLLPVALKLPTLGAASYAAANALSFAFPLPQVYKTFAQGHARGFPLARAAMGAVGTLVLGLVNASVLDKPFWGAMHVFIGLGMMAPYFIGKFLEKKKAGARLWAPAEGHAELGRVKRALARLRGDGALTRTLLTTVPLLAASIGLYAGALAFIPAALHAALTPGALDTLLVVTQLFKAALFIGVFAPDVVALIKGRAPRGFTMGFNLVFFASVASFAAWGFTAAAAEAAGPIREQYLVLALRNLGESTASALSILALWRSQRAAKKNKP